MINVNIKRQTGILNLPDDFAVLEEISTKGYFIYRVKYSADVLRAAQNKSYRVFIRVSNAPYAQRVPVATATLSRQAMLTGLLLGPAQRRDAARSYESNYVLSIQSDISSRISNSKTKELSGFANKLKVGNRGSITTADTFGAQRQTVYDTKNTLALMSVNDLNPQNVAHPVNQTHVFRDNEFSQKTSVYESREIAEDLVFNKLLDPANIAIKTGLIASTKSQLEGLTLSNKTNKPAVDFQRIRFKSDMLRSSLIGQQKIQPDNQFFLGKADKINVRVSKSTNFVDIEETLEIPITSVKDTFYLIFQLYDSSNNEVETVTGVVQHARNVSILTIPTIPPKVTINHGGAPIGSNTFEIRQLDPNAIGVYIYKKFMPRDTAQTDAAYALVAKIPLRPEDGIRRVVDQDDNFNPVIYRVIPYNQYEIKGSEFTSAVIQSRSIPIYAKTPHQRLKTFVSIAYEVLSNGIRLEINDIPTGPIALQLHRRNLSINEPDRLMVGDTFLLNAHGNNATVFFKDLFVEDNRIYEYSVKLIYKDGTTRFSPTTVTVEFSPITNNVINTRVSTPNTVRTGADLDVTFDFENSIVEGKIDLVHKAMRQQGILGFFQDDIAANRQLLQNLIAHRVVRTNVTTGEVEDFGVIVDTTFSDARHGPIKGVKPIKPDNEYRYTVHTHFRSAETLIDTFQRTVKDAVNPNLSYTLTPSKWLHPVTLNVGNIVSARTLATNHSKTDFTFGSVANLQNVSVSLKQTPPTLTDGICQKLGKDKVMIQWKVQGNIQKIDHFIVILEILNMRTIVGKVHNISDTNLVQFIDKIKEGEHAEHVYYIVPVYYDYSRGPELKTSKVIV